MLSTSWSQPGYPGGYPAHGAGYPYPQHQLEEANRRLMMHSSAAHLTNSGQQMHASYTQQTAFGQSQAAGSSQFSQPGPAGQEMFSQSQHSNNSTLRKPVQSQQKPVLASEFTVAGRYIFLFNVIHSNTIHFPLWSTGAVVLTCQLLILIYLFCHKPPHYIL